MRVYLVTKNTLIRVTLLVILIFSGITIGLSYKDMSQSVVSVNKEIPIYSVDTQQKKIAITFDCAWGGEDIPKIIEVLDKYNVRATFFPVGDWMNKYPENVKLLDKKGHEIANHSETHPDLTSLSEEKIKSEIQNTNVKIESITGKKNTIFRAPYGAYNDKVIKTAKSLGQYVIQWDVDSLDWKDLGVENIIDRVTQKVNNGSIVLFHNDTKYTLQALPSVFEKLKSQGYEFVTVSDLILKDNFYLDYQGKQHALVKEKSSID